ncbi:MAG: DUF5067 domain-containing protein [Eubacteriales bacterium]|nr:DUF5067 domain-containing protein [Eubacteriales bacterium]
MKKRSAILFLSAAAAVTFLCTACGSQPEVTDPGSAASQTEQSTNSGSLTSSDLENFNTDSQEVSDTDTPATDDQSTTSNTLQDIDAEEPDTDTDPTSEDESSSEGNLSTDGISVTYGDYIIKVLSCKETTDINNCAALRVTYEFTNRSASQATFSTSIVTSAYQNEYRLANTSPQGVDNEYSAQLEFVQPGNSVTCAAYYLLDNTTDDVNIQVTNLLNSSDETLSLRYSFNK